ncbi:MAG: alpha/beta fold hydrolase [Pseudomonadota bacterium]
MTIRKGYSDGPEGQVHWRASGTSAQNTHDLYCFSPAPFSSIAFTNLMPHLAKTRRIIAPDYPGQGGSDGGSPTPTIEQYAASIIAVIRDLSGDGPVDVLGFHSGCLVAAEAKLQAPDLIDQVLLIDVPAFDPETRSKYLPMVGAPFELNPNLEAVTKAWDMAVTKRAEVQSLDQCYALFADSVANATRMNATFNAAFTCDVEQRLGALEMGATILATQSSLLEASRRAASLIPSSDLVEALDIKRSVLDESAEKTATLIKSILD